VWIKHLTLQNFRNYKKQQLDLDKGLTLLLGDNAQGKSNVLEAVFLLATTRSERASTDADLIAWSALKGAQPVARIVAQVERAEGSVEIEVIISGWPSTARARKWTASKKLRVNGVPRRSVDVVGQLMAVLFTTEDLDLIGGPPSGRRRYLDVTLSQLDPQYFRARRQYEKVITQRNALLRRIQSGEAKQSELDFWDEELARDGAFIMVQRAQAVAALAEHAKASHKKLSDGAEELSITYEPSLDGWDTKRILKKADDLPAALIEAHGTGRPRDIGSGLTLTGPHRDDLTFMLNGVAAASFASRGQQRTAALSLRLAEATFMADRKGDLPVVLLDDVLSELDEARRHAVLHSLVGWDQLLMTSADEDRFDIELPSGTKTFQVKGGVVKKAP
jgi:DNA replication and repair protein RecF